MRTVLHVAVVFLLVVMGCGDDGMMSSSDGAVDAPDAAMGVAPPALPVLTIDGMCPENWTEVTDAMGLSTCEPWPATADTSCPDGEAWFVGGTGCLPIGTPCPVGDFAEDLPTGSPTLYVLAGAVGGDGTRTAPYGTIDDAMASSSPGTVIALAKGSYDAPVQLSPGVTLHGACAAETIISSSTPSDLAGVITIMGADAQVRNLTIGPSRRPGVWVEGAGRGLHLRGVEVRGTENVGIVVFTGALLTAEGLRVAGTDPRSDLRFGRGLIVQAGASATLSRAIFEGNHDVAVSASQPGTTLALTDVAVRDTLGRRSEGDRGWGFSVSLGASATVTRTIFERNRDLGVGAFDPDTTVEITDAVVRDTRPRESDGAGGGGILVELGASAVITRLVVEDNRQSGILVDQLGSTLALTDAVVRGTLSRENDGRFGRGLSLQFGASAMVARAVFEANRDIGVFANNEGTTLALTDVIVRDTLTRESDGEFGRGVSVQVGASVTVTRAIVERSRDVGVLADGPGATAILVDTVVRDTLSQEIDGRFGMGVGAYANAVVRLERFDIVGAALCGVQIATGGQMDLLDGRVRAQPIGACVQVDGYDVGRLTEGVRYEDNESNIQTTELPVPESASSIDTAP
ncbi:MAG: right-handed parallel beta-helix repeat-containing protein [Deltaproteobacteria bacterium]|nr:right-handed parallel beta-helix repeat-containing protein [Deltaproteobacteria bacterium]